MPKIEHVVVLMLENRSFDAMLGQLYPKSERFDGLDMTESNPWHKPDGTVEKIRVWSTQGEFGPRLPDPEPGESFEDITMQLFGLGAAPAGIPSMTGFVDNYLHPKERGDRGSEDITPEPGTIMHTFTPAQTPALSSLARAFGVSDRWFSSAPCETWPNRYFTHAGTAGGWVNNERSRFPYRWPRFLPTIFRRLNSRGYKWRIYFHDLPQAATLVDLWPKIPTRFCLFQDEFERHAMSGRLAHYSFIEPRYFPWPSSPPSDQHPPHDIRSGDQLIASVYNAVRAAPTWEKTLLVVVYDEHGGCFDHVPPPPAVPPGGRARDGFRFDRYGPRVPAVVVSPFVPPGSIIRPPAGVEDRPSYPFDHCSIQATLHRLFDLGPPLTPRVAAAPDLLSALSLAAPDNAGPGRLHVQEPHDAAEHARALRRRPENRHQANLRSPALFGPAAAAHLVGRMRGLGAKTANALPLFRRAPERPH